MTKEIDKPTYQLNPLIEAKKDFDVIENRLFYLGLQDINPHLSENDKFYDKQFPDTVITPAELIKIFGHGQYIKEVDKATDRLIGRYISIRYADGFEKYTIFQHIKYKVNKGLFIKFSEDMKPFILEIYENYKKYGFTKIDMKQIFVLGSSYAMRLLELLLQYRGKAKNEIIEREISVDDLRYKLNVPENAYKTMSNLRSRVLDLPIQDINKNTRYIITYETVKKGRSVSGFRFRCNCSKVVPDDDYTDTIDTPDIPKESSKTPKIKESPALPEVAKEEDRKEQEILNKMVGYHFPLRLINALIDTCGGVDELTRRLEYGEKRAQKDMEKGKKIKSIAGYLRKAIEENWLGLKKDEEKAQERELDSAKTNAEWELWVKNNFTGESVPDVPEKPFDTNDQMQKIAVNVIKKDIQDRKLSFSTKRWLRERGLTVKRFVELYMQIEGN